MDVDAGREKVGTGSEREGSPVCRAGDDVRHRGPRRHGMHAMVFKVAILHVLWSCTAYVAWLQVVP